MEAQEALQAFTNLCEKMSQMIETSEARIEELENKIKRLERKPHPLYTQAQVSLLTGWSIAAVNKWVKNGFIKSVPVSGRKNPLIPASEVDEILAKKGNGRNLPAES